VYVKSVNERPGILALAMRKKKKADGKTTFEGIPFVVPGARFNEVRVGSCAENERPSTPPCGC
jgi:hypothetical protein